MKGEHVSTIDFPSLLGAKAPLEMVVIEPQATYVLPMGGLTRVVIGRAAAANVRLSDEAVSDVHATLLIGDTTLAIKDDDSKNGTTVAGRPVGPSPVPLAPGEAVRVGATILVVRRRPPLPRRKRLRTHHQFMGQLEDECDRAAVANTGLAVIRLRSPLPRDRIASELGRHLTQTDLLGVFADHEYEVLLTPSTPALAARRLEDLQASLRDSAMGMACFAVDGHRADQLVAAASDRLPRPRAAPSVPPRVIAESPAMRELLAKAEVIAKSGAISVLITGETGTGKEVLARFLHDHSARRDRPLKSLDCGAITPTLATDELFGHWRGAFFGADEDRAGILEAANGGTVLLDEFQNLTLEVQALLLRALETREVVRLGSSGGRPPIPIDVRLLVASSRDPADAVQARAMRADLHYRVSPFRLALPPLRERPEDVLPLAGLFLERLCAREGKRLALSEPAMTALREYAWPGNVRELRNVMERAAVLSAGALVEPDDLELPPSPEEEAGDDDAAVPSRLDGLRPEEARRAVTDALIKSGCVKTDAARLLGLKSKTTLLRKMDQLGIPRPRRPKDE
ncbi:MAG TPA: sigma 54-interacting transcriptional regulator [Polyangia bacterium]|jgi:DNA-binding NtrC family response regulator|nr:sigma 54-interacting transcriptional regulator [Polyangia bacterium]